MRKQRNKTNQFKQTEVPLFDSVPIPVLCNSIQMIMDNMASRGFPIRDFDNKDKTVKQVRMIGGRVYFLATKESNHAETT